MSKPLKKRLLLNNLTLTILLTVIVSITTLLLFARTLINNLSINMEETIQQSVDNMAFTLDTIAISSEQLNDNQVLMDALDDDTINPQVQPIINTLRNTSFGIYAVTLYTDSVTYTTFNIRGVEPLSTFEENDAFASFFSSNQTSYLSIRTSDIAENYDYFNYDERYGMVTQVTKLIEDGDVKGYLFVDIKPDYLYSRFLQYDNHQTMQGSASFLLDDTDQFLLSTNNSEALYETAQSMEFDSNLRYFIFTSTLDNQYDIVHIVPTTVVWDELLVVVFYLTIAFVIIYGVAILTARIIHFRIKQPLSKLQYKVTEESNIPD